MSVDMKIFAKNIKGKTRIENIRICCPDIRMEFGIEKSAMLIRKSGKKETKELD